MVLRRSRKWWFYDGKVRDPRAEDLPGAARVSGWARGRSAEVFRRHPGSSGEGFGDHFERKIAPSESKPLPGRFLKVARSGGRAVGSANHNVLDLLKQGKGAGASRRGWRTKTVPECFLRVER